MTSSTFGLQYVAKFNKYLNIKNLVVCKITSEDNNKQYLVSYFYKHVAFLRVLFFKRTCTLRHSSYIFWPDSKCSNWNYSNIWVNTLHHFNVFFHWECQKTSFTCCFIVTATNLIWPVIFCFFCSWWPAEQYQLFAQLCRFLVTSGCLLSRKVWWVVQIGSFWLKNVFYRPKWTTRNWILSIFKFWNECQKDSIKYRWKNGVICQGVMFPSWVLFLKLSRRCIFCNFDLTLARNLKSVETIYIYTSKRSLYTLSKNGNYLFHTMAYWFGGRVWSRRIFDILIASISWMFASTCTTGLMHLKNSRDYF